MAPGGGVALELRQRVTGGATGVVALLPRAAGDAVDVAYTGREPDGRPGHSNTQQ